MSIRFSKSLPVALALTGALLGGCSFTGGVDLAITTPVLTSDYRDGSGNPIICDNVLTPMQFGFEYVGDLQRIEVSLVGTTTGARQAPNVTSANFTGGDGVVNFVVPAKGAPLRVKPEAIIVVPTPNPIGSSKIELRGFSFSGRTRTLSSNAVTVIDNCP